MILADENIHTFTIKTLREAGFDIISVSELSKGIKDEQVIQWAVSNNYMILTEDKDFGEWVFAHHIANLSVILLRYSFEEYQKITRTVSFFLQSEILNHPVFITITPDKIRIRQL